MKSLILAYCLLYPKSDITFADDTIVPQSERRTISNAAVPSGTHCWGRRFGPKGHEMACFARAELATPRKLPMASIDTIDASNTPFVG